MTVSPSSQACLPVCGLCRISCCNMDLYEDFETTEAGLQVPQPLQLNAPSCHAQLTRQLILQLPLNWRIDRRARLTLGRRGRG